MRFTAFAIVVLLGCLSLVPGMGASFSPADATLALHLPDVCHSSGNGINLDMPYLLTCPCMQLPPGFAGVEPAFRAPAPAIPLALQEERPPKLSLS